MEIDRCSVNNGTGIRCVLFVSGCSHHCVGCQNKDSWNYGAGKKFTNKQRDYILKYLESDIVDGITFSGGDPLEKENISCVVNLMKDIHNIFGNTKNIWVYTGYKYEDIDKSILKYIDVLVDGRFELDKRDITLAFRGSSNQRIIDVQKSLKENKIILR